MWTAIKTRFAAFRRWSEGWWTFVAAAVVAELPDTVNLLAGYDFSSIGLSPTAARLIALLFTLLRLYTSKPAPVIAQVSALFVNPDAR